MLTTSVFGKSFVIDENLWDSLVVIKMETRQNKPVLNLQCCSKLLDSGSARARRAVIFEFLTSVRGHMIMITAVTKPSRPHERFLMNPYNEVRHLRSKASQ